jgi:hypothetical protein
MSFEQRSFIGNSCNRPKPSVHYEDRQNLLIIVTPWGPQAPCQKIVNTITEYYDTASGDLDVTSPFERLAYLSPTANTLRIATLLANDTIYNQENRNEYKFAAELFVGAVSDKEIAWLQVGQPHVLLSRKGMPLMPLAFDMDLSFDLTTSGEILPPLPDNLLGVDRRPNIAVQSFRRKSGDRIALVGRTWLPQELFTLNYQSHSLETLSSALALDSDFPYWLGFWSL